MARVFTTTFQYNGETYTDLVSLVDRALTIRLMDGTFELMLPAEQVASYIASGDYGDAPNIIAAVLAAVEGCGVRLQDASSAGQGENAL